MSRRLEPQDLYAIQLVEDPQITPDDRLRTGAHHNAPRALGPLVPGVNLVLSDPRTLLRVTPPLQTVDDVPDDDVTW